MSLLGNIPPEPLRHYYIDQIGFALQFLIAMAITIPGFAILYWKKVWTYLKERFGRSKRG